VRLSDYFRLSLTPVRNAVFSWGCSNPPRPGTFEFLKTGAASGTVGYIANNNHVREDMARRLYEKSRK
jgi:hypothetical protein